MVRAQSLSCGGGHLMSLHVWLQMISLDSETTLCEGSMISHVPIWLVPRSFASTLPFIRSEGILPSTVAHFSDELSPHYVAPLEIPTVVDSDWLC